MTKREELTFPKSHIGRSTSLFLFPISHTIGKVTEKHLEGEEIKRWWREGERTREGHKRKWEGKTSRELPPAFSLWDPTDSGCITHSTMLLGKCEPWNNIGKILYSWLKCQIKLVEVNFFLLLKKNVLLFFLTWVFGMIFFPPWPWG